MVNQNLDTESAFYRLVGYLLDRQESRETAKLIQNTILVGVLQRDPLRDLWKLHAIKALQIVR